LQQLELNHVFVYVVYEYFGRDCICLRVT
jgi:hypothetical protein